jgi:hypothetical protein
MDPEFKQAWKVSKYYTTFMIFKEKNYFMLRTWKYYWIWWYLWSYDSYVQYSVAEPEP